jgi:protein-S-isoprenylcysteine O-methyltransferase Ste14
MKLKQLELKVPPVVIFLIALFAIYGASLLTNFGMFVDNRNYAQFIAFGLAGLGALIGVSGVITFKRAKTTVHPVKIERAATLVSHGIFSYSRNPMYLGLLLILLAAAFYLNANVVLTFFILLSFVFYMNRFQIKPEERVLLKLFGNTYQTYLSTTRRWI